MAEVDEGALDVVGERPRDGDRNCPHPEAPDENPPDWTDPANVPCGTNSL